MKYTEIFTSRRSLAFTSRRSLKHQQGAAASSARPTGFPTLSTKLLAATGVALLAWTGLAACTTDTEENTGAPSRIVALSTETADLALQLAGPERVVAVPATALDETAGNQVELARQVENVVANATKPEPEQILSFNPDLVLMTSRHDQERSAATVMEGTGVATAAFTSSDFASPQAVAQSITTLGDLLGEQQRAATLVDKLNEETTTVLDAVAQMEESPRTLVLFARGGQKMIMGPRSATTNLVEQAGGEVLSPKGPRPGAVAADPEAIVQLAPEVILIQGFHGAGAEQFSELLNNPALAEVPAIKNNRVIVVDAQTTSGTAGTRIAQGLAEVARALHPTI